MIKSIHRYHLAILTRHPSELPYTSHKCAETRDGLRCFRRPGNAFRVRVHVVFTSTHFDISVLTCCGSILNTCFLSFARDHRPYFTLHSSRKDSRVVKGCCVCERKTSSCRNPHSLQITHLKRRLFTGMCTLWYIMLYTSSSLTRTMKRGTSDAFQLQISSCNDCATRAGAQ